jgi:hypothetical protein
MFNIQYRMSLKLTTTAGIGIDYLYCASFRMDDSNSGQNKYTYTHALLVLFYMLGQIIDDNTEGTNW